ncbi:MAG TPA: cupredoxin domain-containing protein [Solirubrobacteraceae bacterium]|nr:cupredoxin domain-containing protein [Solirubrobacteraceae bacterium]
MPVRLLLLLVLVIGAGCGAEKAEPDPSGGTAATADPPAVAPSPTAAAAPAAAAVSIKGFTYSPARVAVREGGTVTWTDEDASNHTVTFEDEGPKDVGNLREGSSATVKFAERGRYAYVCDFHPGMAGTVVVG